MGEVITGAFRAVTTSDRIHRSKRLAESRFLEMNQKEKERKVVFFHVNDLKQLDGKMLK